MEVPMRLPAEPASRFAGGSEAATLTQPSTTGAATLTQPSTTGTSSTGAAAAADPTLHARRTGSLAEEAITTPERPSRRAHSYEAAEAQRR